MWHRGPKPVVCRFWLFYFIIFYTACASKCFLQNQNILFLTEVILVWLDQKSERNRKKSLTFCVIEIPASARAFTPLPVSEDVLYGRLLLKHHVIQYQGWSDEDWSIKKTHMLIFSSIRNTEHETLHKSSIFLKFTLNVENINRADKHIWWLNALHGI